MSPGLIGYTIDLHLAVDNHARYDACASGRVFAEVFFEDRIEWGKVARIFEPDATADYVLRAVPGFVQNRQQIANRLLRLRGYVAGDNLTVDHRNLARNIQPS